MTFIIGAVFVAVGLFLRFYSDIFEVHDSTKSAIEAAGKKTAAGCLYLFPLGIGILFIIASFEMNF